MKQASKRMVATVGVSLILAWSTAISFAAGKLNYSGTYSVQKGKAAKASAAVNSILHVVQNDDTIEVTRMEEGRSTTSLFPLNGSEGVYTSPGGVSGRGIAQFKDKYLVLESVVVTKPQPSAPPVHMRIKERWQLSTDSKILTIRVNMDFPDVPGLGMDQSWTETYARAENP